MIRLFAVEIRRDLARRVTKLLVVAFLALVIVGTSIAMVNVDAESNTEIEARQTRGLALCVDDVGRAGTPPLDGFDQSETGDAIAVELEPVAPSDVEARCRALLDAYLSGRNDQLWYFDDPRPNIKRDLWSDQGDRTDSSLLSVTALLMICGMAAGASMIGAEWKYGTIVTQLTWEPRRVRLYATKVLAAATVAFAIAVGLVLAFCAILYPFFAAKGVTQGMDADWYLSLAGMALRAGALTGISAVLGISLAMLLRNTAGAIVIVFGYLAVAENLLRAWKPHWSEWLVGDNITVFITGQTDYVDFDTSLQTAGLTLVFYATILAVAATISFQLRDIAGSS